MNLDYEQQLAAVIDRELKALPDLAAPQTLLPRVMAAIRQPAKLPWHRRGWQTWPSALRVGSLLILLSAFAGVCFGSWQVLHTSAVVSALENLGSLVNWLRIILETAGVLVNAAGLAFKGLNSWVLAGCLVMLAFAYTACLGLGTICWRLAYERH